MKAVAVQPPESARFPSDRLIRNIGIWHGDVCKSARTLVPLRNRLVEQKPSVAGLIAIYPVSRFIRQALSSSVRLKNPQVVSCDTTAFGNQPQISILTLVHRLETIGYHPGCTAFVEDCEMHTVEAGQPIKSCDP